MKNKIFIITLCIIFVVSLIVYKKDKSEFTHEEYKVIREQVTKFFENEDFSCKNERNESDYENWTEWGGRKNTDIYVDPVVCKKISEKEIDGNIYKSEITYSLPQYESMVYDKATNVSNELNIIITNTYFPKEKLLNDETFMYFRQGTDNNILYFKLEKYDEHNYLSRKDRYIYIGLSNSQSDIEYYKYYQNIFRNELPYEVKKNTTVEESNYFDLLVEKGYAENLLNEFKVNKEEADEIAQRFEKSEIYDKIYNLKY